MKKIRPHGRFFSISIYLDHKRGQNMPEMSIKNSLWQAMTCFNIEFDMEAVKTPLFGLKTVKRDHKLAAR